MQWRETLSPIRMDRVAVIAPADRTREALEEVARSAAVELELPYTPGDGPEELDRAAEAAVENGAVSGLVGWAPSRRVPELQQALRPLGAGLVPLKAPRGVQPPTLLTGSERRTRQAPKLSRLLVDTYTTVPYADVDPARLAGLAYVVMFGMMFGDAGQGLLLVIAGLIVRSGRIARIRRFSGPGCSSSVPVWQRCSSGCCTASSSAPPTSFRCYGWNPWKTPYPCSSPP